MGERNASFLYSFRPNSYMQENVGTRWKNCESLQTARCGSCFRMLPYVKKKNSLQTKKTAQQSVPNFYLYRGPLTQREHWQLASNLWIFKQCCTFYYHHILLKECSLLVLPFSTQITCPSLPTPHKSNSFQPEGQVAVSHKREGKWSGSQVYILKCI